MQKVQLLSPPDGHVVETLTDPRILATVGGVVAGNTAEKALFKGARQLFGVAAPAAGGTVKYFAAKEDGTADTSKESATYRTNRNVARAAGVIGAIAAIEYSNNGVAQYTLLGSAAVWFSHIVHDLVPALR